MPENKINSESAQVGQTKQNSSARGGNLKRNRIQLPGICLALKKKLISVFLEAFTGETSKPAFPHIPWTAEGAEADSALPAASWRRGCHRPEWGGDI